MHRTGTFRTGIAAAAVFLLAAPALAGGIDDFKLTRAIPADAFMAIHARGHDGQAFVNKQFERVWKALENSRLDRDVRRLFKKMAEQQHDTGGEEGDAQQGDEFDEHWRQMSDLLAGVEWSTLMKREFAMGMKLRFPAVETVFLMQPPADKVADDFEGLSAFLKTFAELAPDEMLFSEDKTDDAVIRKVSFIKTPFPVEFCVARHKDVIVAGIGGSLVEQTLALLSGEAGQSLASTSRFRTAFESLPEPTDELVFVDLAKLFQQVNAMVERMFTAGPGQGSELDPQIKALPKKIFDAIDMFEYSAAVVTTDGMRTTTDAVTVLRDDAHDRLLYRTFFGNKAIENPLKFIPKDAVSFSVSNGIDLAEFYRVVVKFIEQNVPDGEQTIATWTAAQEGNGINIENDVLAWIEGGFTSFSMPGRTGFQQGGSAMMLTVHDEQKARDALDRLFDAIGPFLEGNNGSVSEAVIEGAEGFRSIGHPFLMMMPGLSRPTLGVAQGRLIFGSSPKIINQLLAVGAGKEENFADSPRLRKDGIPPTKGVVSIGFTDLTGLAKELETMLSIPTMLGFFMGPQIADNPVLAAAIRALPKLLPVVRELNFFQSQASRSTFDGKVVTTRSILTYREPPAKIVPSSENSSGDSGR